METMEVIHAEHNIQVSKHLDYSEFLLHYAGFGL